MIIYRKILAKWVIAPNTLIEGSDFLSEIYLLLLKLTNITKLSIDVVSSKFGFEKKISTFLIDSMLSKNLLKESNEAGSYVLDNLGEKALEKQKISIIEKTHIRLLLIEDPTFILKNYWYIPNANIFDDRMYDSNLKAKILSRKDFCGLNENVIGFTDDFEIISQQTGILSLDFDDSYPGELFVNLPSSSEYSIPIKEDDPIVTNLYSELSSIHNEFDQFVTDKLQITFKELSFESTIEKLNNDTYDVELSTLRPNVIEEFFKFNNWIGSVRHVSNTNIELKVDLFNEWYIWISVKLHTNNHFIIYILFKEFILLHEDVYSNLVLSNNFFSDLEKALADFCQNHDFSIIQVDKEKIAEVFWFSERSKIFVSKLYEEEILNE